MDQDVVMFFSNTPVGLITQFGKQRRIVSYVIMPLFEPYTIEEDAANT